MQIHPLKRSALKLFSLQGHEGLLLTVLVVKPLHDTENHGHAGIILASLQGRVKLNEQLVLSGGLKGVLDAGIVEFRQRQAGNEP